MSHKIWISKYSLSFQLHRILLHSTFPLWNSQVIMKIVAIMLLLNLNGQGLHREMDLITLNLNIQPCRTLVVVEVYPQKLEIQLQEIS